jgi:low affinity Fe/Cu permease
LIQKFILFLGNPTYALSVIVFSMLISSGLGSYFSRRFAGADDAEGLSFILAGVAVLIAILAFVAQPLSEFGVGWPLPLKIAVTVALIAPAAFLMGMPFPAGLARLQSRFPETVRWAWALNSASSVLGSAAAIFLAIYIGLRATLLVSAALYLGALIVARLESGATEVSPACVTAANQQVAVREPN